MSDFEIIKNELIKLNNKVDNGFNFINKKFKHIELRLDHIELRLDDIDNTLKSNNIRFINVEKEFKINLSFYQKNKELINNIISGSFIAFSNFLYNKELKND